jgi:two-component system CheB/CheR fusion protein
MKRGKAGAGVRVSHKTEKVPFAPDSPTNAKETNNEAHPFPVVGIGASAGGLAAFEAFFSGMPEDRDPGMSFVLVQHLAPDHKSILTDLISRYTRMKVLEVENGMVVEQNCAYIIPPNRDMELKGGTLLLTEPAEPRGHRYPIDIFFGSLARGQGERAICVVLSGTGSDGTEGVRAIKAEGGMVMVQDPATTEYDGMPRSAISTGLSDYTLAPGQMAAQLIAYSARIFRGDSADATAGVATTEPSLKNIFELLHSRTGHDFSQYKSNTIRRRIARRMAVQQIETLDAYLEYMRESDSEIDKLFRELMIGVTSFFRDEDCFSALAEKGVPMLIAGKPDGSVIRVWSPGCSTGEEAYSIAMLLREQLEAANRNLKVQIFSTDIDSNAIVAARAGIYSARAVADITPERLSKFFIADSDIGPYRIRKEVRDMLVFSEQDVIKDPPFSKIDLISCRNLLIYLGGDLQRKLLRLFHYALNPRGLLFLGNSETIGDFGDFFLPLNRKARLYERRDPPIGSPQATGGRFMASWSATNAAPLPGDGTSQRTAKWSLREIAEKALLQEMAPSAALVNSRGDVLYIHGRTGSFLEPSPGEAGVSNILKMAREGLQQNLNIALHNAVSSQQSVHRPGLRVKTNGDFAYVDLVVIPVTEATVEAPDTVLYLVILRETESSHVEKTEPSASKDDEMSAVDARMAELRQELDQKERFLQTAVEDLETTNEELKSSNEEMQSVNEELQSTNEELETSKEELQSVNEELATVNAELQTKVADLSRANNDMNNLLAGTGIGTVFVDHDMRILRFTPAVTQIISLIPNDVGRPVGQIVSNLIGYDRLVEDVRGVLDTLVPVEAEVQASSGEWYVLRIMPYRTVENKIEGAVITFIQITEMKRANAKINELLRAQELLLKEVHHRIKNNMSTIMSLLSLQSERLTNSEAIEALGDARNRINTMAALYERLYLSQNTLEVSLKSYIAPLIEYALQSLPDKKNVTVEQEVDDILLDAKHLFPIGILVNELLANIVKYAFIGRPGGVITVLASRHDGHVTLVVGDNGIGIPEAVSLEHSTGFGIVLVAALTDQLKGTIKIERENGTRFILGFDL